MSEKTQINTGCGGIGILGILGVVFTTLKLCGVINWSWWYVLMPFYAPTAIVFAIISSLFVFSAICFVVAGAIEIPKFIVDATCGGMGERNEADKQEAEFEEAIRRREEAKAKRDSRRS